MGSVIDGETSCTTRSSGLSWRCRILRRRHHFDPAVPEIAHNRALDLLRSREVRMAEPIDAAADVADSAQPDPLEVLMRKERSNAVSRFVELPTLQRSVVS